MIPDPRFDMDSSLYKDVRTSRGFNYHYLAVAPQADKPYLLFIHGFPSTSYDWRYQVTYFSELGYGLIVPDMLGYGGTSKPTEVEAYTNSRSSKDLIDILDAEGITKCIAIGHDWYVSSLIIPLTISIGLTSLAGEVGLQRG